MSIAYGLTVVIYTSDFGECLNLGLVYCIWGLVTIHGALHPLACIHRNQKLREGLKTAVCCMCKCFNGSPNAVTDLTLLTAVVDHQQGPGSSMRILQEIWTTGKRAQLPVNKRVEDKYKVDDQNIPLETIDWNGNPNQIQTE